jgi:hypothetical protein
MGFILTDNNGKTVYTRRVKKKLLAACISIMLCLNSASIFAEQLKTLEPLCCCETNCECEHAKNPTPILRNVACGDNVPGAMTSSTFQQLISQTHQSLIANNTHVTPWDAPPLIIKDVGIDIFPPPPKTPPGI